MIKSDLSSLEDKNKEKEYKHKCKITQLSHIKPNSF